MIGAELDALPWDPDDPILHVLLIVRSRVMCHRGVADLPDESGMANGFRSRHLCLLVGRPGVLGAPGLVAEVRS